MWSNVGESLGEQVLGGQARATHVVHRDGRNAIESLLARQDENRRGNAYPPRSRRRLWDLDHPG